MQSGSGPAADGNPAQFRKPTRHYRNPSDVLTGIGDTDDDGDYDKIYALGGRGVTIFKQEADGSITKVRETGGKFEAITAALANKGAPAFNSNQSNANSSFDTRSNDKGPEPEGVTTGVINGRTYAFFGLERIGGLMVYDVTDPGNAFFVGYQKQAATTRSTGQPADWPIS